MFVALPGKSWDAVVLQTNIITIIHFYAVNISRILMWISKMEIMLRKIEKFGLQMKWKRFLYKKLRMIETAIVETPKTILQTLKKRQHNRLEKLTESQL